MKDKSIYFESFIVLLVFLVAGVQGQQQVKWKGTSEVENGIRVVKNPK